MAAFLPFFLVSMFASAFGTVPPEVEQLIQEAHEKFPLEAGVDEHEVVQAVRYWRHHWHLTQGYHGLQMQGISADVFPHKPFGNSPFHHEYINATMQLLGHMSRAHSRHIEKIDPQAGHIPAPAGTIPEQVPRYGGKTEDGAHRIHLGGAPVHADGNVAKKTLRKLNKLDFPKGFGDNFGGNCVEKPIGYTYLESSTGSGDDVYTDKTCTCNNDGIQLPTNLNEGPKSSIAVGKLTMNSRWCKCKENFQTGIGLALGGYSYVGWECDRYPAMAPSTCDIKSDASPKQAICEYSFVLAKGVALVLGLELNVGYGVTGKSNDLIAEFAMGVRTSFLPRPVYGSYCGVPTCLGKLGFFKSDFPNPLGGDFSYDLVQFIGKEAMGLFDIAKAVAGDEMAGTLSYFPAQFRYPKTYESTTGKKRVIGRFPLTASADSGSVDTKGFDFASGKPLCLTNLGNVLKAGGDLKLALKFLGILMGLTGSDLCISTPGFDNKGEDLKMGIKISGYGMDKTKVNPLGLVQALPEGWNSLPKALGQFFGAKIPGFKEVLESAMKFSAQSVCEGEKAGAITVPCTAFKAFGEIYSMSIEGEMKKYITQFFPDKPITIELDIGKVIGQVKPDLVTGPDKNLLVFPKMFSSQRRRRLNERMIMSLPLATGHLSELVQHGRMLADNTFKFPTDGVFVKEGSACEITYKGMPKSLKCTLKAGIGEKFSLSMAVSFTLGYDINGEDLVIVAETGFGSKFGDVELEGIDDALKNKLSKIDLGALIDESFAGCIQLAPPGISFPSTFMEKGDLFTIARVKLPSLKDPGVCLSNLEDFVPEPLKMGVKKVTGMIQKVTGLVGGDVCTRTPNIECTEKSGGFKIDVKGDLKLFVPDLINIYPIVQVIGNLIPQIKPIFTAIDTCCGDTLKTILNKAVQTIAAAAKLEKKFTVDIGLLVAKAAGVAKEGAKIFTGDLIPTRRHLAEALVNPDGTFNMGGVPPSDKPGSAGVAPDQQPEPIEDNSGGDGGDGGNGGNGGNGGGGASPAVIAIVVTCVVLVVGGLAGLAGYWVWRSRNKNIGEMENDVKVRKATTTVVVGSEETVVEETVVTTTTEATPQVVKTTDENDAENSAPEPPSEPAPAPTL